MVKDSQAIQVEVKVKLEATNAKLKASAGKHCHAIAFEAGNEVTALLHKERFSIGKYHKLQPMKHGRYKILQRINPNAYVVDLLSCMGISRTFNVSGLYFYPPSEQPLYLDFQDNSRARSS